MGKRKGKRRQARENALIALYQGEIKNNFDLEMLLNSVTDNEHVNPFPNEELLKDILSGVIENKTQLDEIISKYLENWTLERVALIEKIILRVALYELLFIVETPTNVVIDEAVDIAKLYGDTNSYIFVNGILDKMSHNLDNIRKDFYENRNNI